MRLIGLAIALALALGLTLAPILAEAQQARKVWRIGVLRHLLCDRDRALPHERH